MSSTGQTALVLGATGAIGKELVRELINCPRYSKIVLITRRELPAENYNSDRICQKVVNFDNLNDYKDDFRDSNVAFCCLGTTRAKSGADGFVRVDKDYVFQSANILKEVGCPHFSLITSKGSNSGSSFLYLKTKGEVESLITDLDFTRFSIFRPGFLICNREESRPFEKVAQILAKGFDVRNKISVAVETVAHAMLINSLLDNQSKVEIFEHSDINKLGMD